MDGDREGPGARLALARRLAEEAGRVLEGHFGHLSHVHRKGAVDLVTAADREAEALILRGVREAFPDDGWLGEETGQGGAAGATWTWVVDPLDGTTNFVHGIPHYAVSIGLLREGEPAIGVIHAPGRRQTCHAVAGGGAWCGDARLRVTDAPDLGDALVATGFPYDRRQTAEALLRPVRRALERARGLRRMGAAALDLLDVARGVFGGFWERGLQPWDLAAGVVLVREAGGIVTGYGGRPLDLGRGEVVAAAPALHAALVDVVGDA